MNLKVFDELKSTLFWRDAGAEFVASFCLMAAQCALPTQWGQPVSPSAAQVGIGMGFVVFIMASSLGDFGGAHMNPAVSIAMMVSQKITVIRGKYLYYCNAQILGVDTLLIKWDLVNKGYNNNNNNNIQNLCNALYNL